MRNYRWIIFLTAVFLLGGCAAAPAANQVPDTGLAQQVGTGPVNLPVILPTFSPTDTPTQAPTPTAAPVTALTPAPPGGSLLPFAVTGVDTSAALDGYTYSDACQATYTFQANIGASGSGSIRYHWLRSDGSTTREASLAFSGSQIQKVTDVWTIRSPDASITGSDQLVIDQPAGQTYAPAGVSAYCAPPAPPKRPAAPARNSGSSAAPTSAPHQKP